MDTSLILNKNIESFLNWIKSLADSGQHHKFNKKSGGFPILIDGGSPYYEQNYYEEHMENAIWKYLVNGVLKDLFSMDYCKNNEITVIWANMHPQLTFSYVEEIENHYPVEFTIECSGKRTAYRYTNWYCIGEKRKEFLAAENIDELVIIDFSSDKLSSLLHPALISDNVVAITAKTFFETFFSESIFTEYLSSVRQAISEAYKYVGFQTISNLTSQKLPFFIDGMLNDIRNTVFCDQQYQVMGKIEKRWIKEKYNDPQNIFLQDDYKIMNQRFFENKRFLAMCGASDFAHSLITSEYLYQTMKDNNQFDFTAIVCGYLKSIEQLLHKLVLFTVTNHTGELWIKSKGNDKRNPQNFTYLEGRTARHVKFETGLERYFDTTFAALVNLLDDNENGWNVSKGAKNAITVRLAIYCDECRNEHFHKDNINTIVEVENIRKNTLLLFYYVLGGYKLTDKYDEDNEELQIIDRSFEELYNKIMQFGCGEYYILEFSDGEEILVAMPMGQENPSYDDNGSLKNTSIRFVKTSRSLTEDWHSDNWSAFECERNPENTIYVTPENVPSKIIYLNKLTNKRTTIKN